MISMPFFVYTFSRPKMISKLREYLIDLTVATIGRLDRLSFSLIPLICDQQKQVTDRSNQKRCRLRD